MRVHGGEVQVESALARRLGAVGAVAVAWAAVLRSGGGSRSRRFRGVRGARRRVGDTDFGPTSTEAIWGLRLEQG